MAYSEETIMARLAFKPANVIADAQTITQYVPVAIDLSPYTSPGDRLYAIDLPEGLEVMADAHRILGAPTTTQTATTHNVYCQAASGPDFWITIDFTVTAPPGNVYTTVTNLAQMVALPEFANAYSGNGCVIELGAGVQIDLTTANFFGKFRNLTSPIVIKSADLGNRASFTGNNWTFNGTSPDVMGDISFVDIDFTAGQAGPARAFDDPLPGVRQHITVAGSTSIEKVAAIRCKFISDVPDASSRTQPKDEVGGVRMTNPSNRIAIWGCTFTQLFNGVAVIGTNILVARNEQFRSWGDMVRVAVSPGNPTTQYVLVCDNTLYDSTADGFIRHPDGVQMFASGGTVDGSVQDFERRGDLAFSGTTYVEMSATPPAYGTGDYVDSSTNENATTVDFSTYRLRTDTAGSDLTLTLPAIASVGTGFTINVQKYSGDTLYDVIVARNTATTINGISSDYSFSGKFKSVLFSKTSATNWSAVVGGIGIQNGLYQDDGGLDELNRSLIWYGITTSQTLAGHSFEVIPKNAKVESCTLIRAIPQDIDGDGIIDANDGYGTEGYPLVILRGNAADSELTVTKTIAPGISKDVGAPLSTLTQSDNDTSQGAVDANTQSLFVGEGKIPFNRAEQIYFAQHKTTGAAAGTGRGAISYGPATLGYDFLNKRVRIPGAPECTAPPVIQLSGSTYQITTDATFDKAGTKSYQWCCNHEPIAGQTGTTLTQANAPAGRITLRVTLPDATYGDCIAESNGLIEA
jgi:hypothetical protein